MFQYRLFIFYNPSDHINGGSHHQQYPQQYSAVPQRSVKPRLFFFGSLFYCTHIHTSDGICPYQRVDAGAVTYAGAVTEKVNRVSLLVQINAVLLNDSGVVNSQLAVVPAAVLLRIPFLLSALPNSAACRAQDKHQNKDTCQSRR